MLTRRRLITGAVALTAAASLNACASPSAGTGSAKTRRTVDGESARGLVIALNAALATLDPAVAQSQRTEGNVFTNVYSTLVRTNPAGELEGDIATAWRQPDPNTWVFDIRPGVRYSNGDPLGAPEVAAALARYFDASVGTNGRNAIPSFSTVTANAQSQVVITTTAPNFQLPAFTEQLYLVDPAWVARGGNAKAEVLGSGPYTMVSYDPQGQIVLVRNESYYGAKPFFKNVTLRVIPEESGRIAAVQAGEIDLVTSFDPQSLDQLKGNGALKVDAVPGLRTHFLLFDTRSAPFNNVEVRRAVNDAINKQAITASIFKGLVQPGPFITEGAPGYLKDQPAWPFDPAKARQELAAAGLSGGFSTEILDAPGSYAGDDLTVQAIAQQLSAVGIQAKIRNLPYTTYLKQLFPSSPDEHPSGINFRSYPGTSRVTVAATRYRSFLTGVKGSFYSDPVYDALYKQLDSAMTEQAQDEIFRQLNARLHDQAALAYLFNEPLTYAVKTSLAWTPRGEQWLRAYDVTAAR